jgi:hypothetical protein
MRSVVREVGKRFPTAIVSGRSRDKVNGSIDRSYIYIYIYTSIQLMQP